jgi:hypothetical protein
MEIVFPIAREAERRVSLVEDVTSKTYEQQKKFLEEVQQEIVIDKKNLLKFSKMMNSVGNW